MSRRSTRIRALAAVALAATALLATPFVAVGSASAEIVAPEPRATPGPSSAAAPLVAMAQYSADDYAAQASELPAELATALADDLGQTPADYLARADAAANASAVVHGLTSAGVDVLGAHLDGTALVVNVADTADADLVAAVDATPVLGEPQAFDPGEAEPRLLKDLVGGQGFFSTDSVYNYYCSVAFNGVDRVSGQKQFLTAGHCKVDGTDQNGRVTELVQPKPNVVSGAGDRLGDPVGGSFALGNELDTGLVASTTSTWTPKPAVGTWNGNTGPVTSGSQQVVRDYGDAIVGQPICKSGRTTGWTCGTVEATDVLLPVKDGGDTEVEINVDITTFCALPGDSGGAVVSGPYAMGLLSSGNYVSSCSEPSTPDNPKFSGVFPMISAPPYGSVLSSELNWQLEVAVEAPVVAQPASGGTLTWGQPITGTLPSGSTRHSVLVSIDGGPATSTSVAQDGTWSLFATGITGGAHTYRATAVFGSGAGTSTSAAVTGSFTVVGAPSVSRISGTDRYEGAVKISQAAYPAPATVPVVYVATGQNYPDALSAGPAAVKQGGPLLLVTRDDVPAVVQAEITRLAPDRIVVVGGPNSVSDAVAGQLGTLVEGTSVERLAGADRYAASRAVVQTVFGIEGATAPNAYAATGTNFPDALSAGGAAGSSLQPVVLVNGSQPSADAETLQLFRTLQTQSIVVAGGPNSVSQGVLDSLAGVPASVTRVAAADRYQTSIALNQAFSSTGTVYLATGLNFPDALAGGVLAGTGHAPLYVVPTDCVPRGVLSDIQRLGATKVVLLGGPNSLSQNVQNLAACPA